MDVVLSNLLGRRDRRHDLEPGGVMTSGDPYTMAELERLAYIKHMGGSVSILMSEFGTHTEASWEMTWKRITGELLDGHTDLTRAIAAKMDADPFYEGWRER